MFLEKPVAETLADADAMIAACRAAGAVVAVNHYRTFDPYYAAARALLRAGEIGEVVGVKATWGEGFAQGGCHLFDLLRYLLDSPVDWVFCHLDDDRSLVDPGGDAYLVYRNGVRAHVHMPWDGKAPSELDLVGSEGLIRMGAYAAQWWKLIRRGERSVPVEWPFPGRHDGHSGMYAALEQLIGAIEGGPAPASTLDDGRAVLEMTVALLKSGQSGQTGAVAGRRPDVRRPVLALAASRAFGEVRSARSRRLKRHTAAEGGRPRAARRVEKPRA